MKAYEVQYKDSGWCDFVHANNAREARRLFWACWGREGDFIDIRVRRAPELDALPLIGVNIVNAGFDEEWITEKSEACRCNLCKGIPEATA